MRNRVRLLSDETTAAVVIALTGEPSKNQTRLTVMPIGCDNCRYIRFRERMSFIVATVVRSKMSVASGGVVRVGIGSLDLQLKSRGSEDGSKRIRLICDVEG